MKGAPLNTLLGGEAGGDQSDTGFLRRRISDLAYVLTVSLIFPLYWAKAMDARLCTVGAGAEHGKSDPWIMDPPPTSWIQSWPCSGSQLAKLAYVASSPGPLLRSLFWPCWLSELHFTSTFTLVVLGGLLMVALIPTSEYKSSNPWRVAWAITCKAHIKAVPIVVRLLRPGTPWPLAVAQNLHTEGAGTLFLSFGVSLPVPAQAVVSLLDVLELALIVLTFGQPWPFPVSPMGLVLRQMVAGVVAVGVSAFLHGGFTAAVDDGCGGKDSSCDSAAAASTAPYRLQEAPEAAAALCAAAAAVAAGGPAVADGALPGNGDLDAAATRTRQLFELATCLTTAVAGAGDNVDVGPDAGGRPRAVHGGGVARYSSPLAITTVRLKLPDVEPWQLQDGIRQRVAKAVASAGGGTAAAGVAVNVAVRSGCVELHLDLLRSAAGMAAEAAESSALGLLPHAPVPVEQQRMVCSILDVLGLPPGYDATVRAQVGQHLLTLTPAAPAAADDGNCGGGGGAAAAAWAVLGTRRLQANEVPWVSRVEPAAVVPAAGVDGSPGDDGAATAMRLTVCGPAERLARAHEDAELELLAMFEGNFLRVLEGRWGAMQGLPTAADGAGAAAWRCEVAPAGCCERELVMRLAVPRGRSGIVRLVLVRRGTSGQGRSLLLLRPEEAALAAEVVELQRRTAAAAMAAAALAGLGDCTAAGPTASSVDRFVEDLGRWLQYRDFWLTEAAEAEAEAAAVAAQGEVASSSCTSSVTATPVTNARHHHRRSSWPRAGALLRLLSLGGARRNPAVGGATVSLPMTAATAAAASMSDGAVAAALGVLHGPTRGAVSDCSCGACPKAVATTSTKASGASVTAAGHTDSPQVGPSGPMSQTEKRLGHREQSRGWELSSFRTVSYQEDMRRVRRSLVEFALEQRCPAIAATLLAAHSVPAAARARGAGPGADADAARCGGSGGAAAAADGVEQLLQLAEASRAASPDGLTLLHRAVRSGDAATVGALLRAASSLSVSAASPTSPAVGLPLPPPPSRYCCLASWDLADAYGLTPLHYLAVLPDGGTLARAVLVSEQEALGLWGVERPGMPSPASFARDNGLQLDVAALQAQPLEERRPAKDEEAKGGAQAGGAQDGDGKGADGGLGCLGNEGTSLASVVTALSASASSSPLPLWLLLGHGVACVVGLLQVP
ncbi:hypothetical protein GPECTOR_17g851 [Gonium pectorale]|uniref:Uncharacterized protein n=1 Tax=Gonium pectorale TaxID=33097 RepID=A0A150GKA4_GONPE|nr:hypothetical protein GPECTOR_17g851 [Gonium pectorale]|eukprot:KXZ50214.1 hypothetical protein GPECTOR_17g851 [Gonium pectorale]